MNNDRRSSYVPMVAGALSGAVAMYFLDPRLGHRRRVLVRDQIRHLARAALNYGTGAAIDLFQRTRGLGYEIVRAYRNLPVSDDVLVARVRSLLGHHLPQMGMIEVTAAGDEVTLSGPIAQSHLQTALRAAAQAPGVRLVHNQLFPQAKAVVAADEHRQSAVG